MEKLFTAANLIKQFCREKHEYVLEMNEQFFRFNTNKPKFSMNWINHLAHNDVNQLFHIDDQLSNYFDKNIDIFNETFIILMGDHGSRHSKLRTMTTVMHTIQNMIRNYFRLVKWKIQIRCLLLEFQIDYGNSIN